MCNRVGVCAHRVNALACVCVYLWGQRMSVCSCAFQCVPTLRSPEVCHSMSLGRYPTPSLCQKSVEFAPLTSGSDLHDTIHYHFSLETQQHEGAPDTSVGNAEACVFGICSLPVASIKQDEATLRWPANLRVCSICLIYSSCHDEDD